MKFVKYNEISNNFADSTIRAPTIHICENSTLNLSANTLSHNVEILHRLKNSKEIETCAIRYISERGNLDKEFQMGQKLNYSIIHNNVNDMYVLFISSIDLNHCEWDSTSAFLTSSPHNVNQRFNLYSRKFLKVHVKNKYACAMKLTSCQIATLKNWAPIIQV